MPLPFIAGMLIGAGAITAYKNKEKVIKCLKTGFATAKTSGENLVQKVKSKYEKKSCKCETQVVQNVGDECGEIVKGDHILRTSLPRLRREKECKSRVQKRNLPRL